MSAGPPLGAALLALATGAVAGGLLARAARALGWGDAAAGPDAWRKLQDRPVPPVGGPAILCGLVAAEAAGAAPWGAGAPAAGLALALEATAGSAWAAIFAAFAVGLADDLAPGGLRPRAKLAGQALAGLALAAPAWTSGAGAGPALLASLAAAAAVCFAANVWNTFDNADGAATGLGGLGLAAGGAGAAGAALGFLPWNLLRPRGAPGAAATPRPPTWGSTDAGGAGFPAIPPPASACRPAPVAYLGDSGSHLLGMLVLLTPGAWPAFLLPAADLARLCVVRVRRGRAPWQGDRRHLAHRLERAGLGRLAVLAVLLAIGSIPLVWRGAGGLVAGLAAFALAVAITPDPDAEQG